MNIQHYSPVEIREYKKSLKTTFDKIQAYYLLGGEKIALTPKQEEQRLRLEETWTFLNKYKTRERVRNLLVTRYKYSIRSAYEDINDAYRLFGNVNDVSQKGLKHLLTESALRMLNKAETTGKHIEYNMTLSNLIKLNGLDKPELMEEDPEKYAPCTIIISSDVATLERQAKAMVADVEDIDYEDIEDETTEEEGDIL